MAQWHGDLQLALRECRYVASKALSAASPPPRRFIHISPVRPDAAHTTALSAQEVCCRKPSRVPPMTNFHPITDYERVVKMLFLKQTVTTRLCSRFHAQERRK